MHFVLFFVLHVWFPHHSYLNLQYSQNQYLSFACTKEKKKSPLVFANINAQHKLSFIIIYHHPCLSSLSSSAFPAPTANKENVSLFTSLSVLFSQSHRVLKQEKEEFSWGVLVALLSRSRYIVLSFSRGIETWLARSVDFLIQRGLRRLDPNVWK